MRRLLGARDEGEKGFALVAVLLFMLLMAAVMTPLSIHGTEYRQIAVYRSAALADRLLAEGVARLVSLLPGGSENESGQVGAWWRCKVQEREVFVRMQDTTGLIDLNSSEEDLVAIGLIALGRDEATAHAGAKDVVRYRTPNLAPDFGATASELPAVARGAPFVSVAELDELLVLSAQEALVADQVFTIYNKRGSVARPFLDARLGKLMSGPGKAGEFVTDFGTDGPFLKIWVALFSDPSKSGTIFGFNYQRANVNSRLPGRKDRSEVMVAKAAFDNSGASIASCPSTLEALLHE